MAAVVGGGHRTKYPKPMRWSKGVLSISTTKPGWTPPTSAATPATETPAKPTSSTKPSSFRSPTTKKSTGSRRRRAGIIDA